MKIEIDLPNDATGLREALCQAIDSVLQDRNVVYRVKGTEFTIPEASGPDLKIQSPEEFRKNPDYQPVLVPLGPNVTRDGYKARVLANDRAGDLPIIALVERPDGLEGLATTRADGMARLDGVKCQSDLVGHLPPSEPAKPKNYWLQVNSDGETFIRSGPSLNPGERILVREVLPGQDDELEALRRWKKEALMVESTWDEQAVGKELGLRLGSAIRPAILPKIRAYKKLLERAQNIIETKFPNLSLIDEIRKALINP